LPRLAVTTLIGGFAVDRYGARLVLTIAALLWSLSIGAALALSSVVVVFLAHRPDDDRDAGL
jgi:MFS transporter, ACS family, hexuronate transporter